MAKPASTSAVEQATETTVIRNLPKKRSTLRMVDLYLKESLFQMRGMRSKNTFLPRLGTLGRSRSAGCWQVSLCPATAVAMSVDRRMSANVPIKKPIAILEEQAGSTYSHSKLT